MALLAAARVNASMSETELAGPRDSLLPLISSSPRMTPRPPGAGEGVMRQSSRMMTQVSVAMCEEERGGGGGCGAVLVSF